MTLENVIPLAAWAALGTAALAGLAEALQARRMRRLGRLAFGPGERPRAWTVAVPILRVVALSAVMAALVVLLAFEGGSRSRERQGAPVRHLMVLLDVSPSMQLVDAGEGGQKKRAQRAAELLQSVLERAPGDDVKVTMACFYSHAMPLVRESTDREVVWHFVDDLPLYIAFKHGKTDLVKSLNQAGEMVAEFPRRSTTFLVLTDGDTVPESGLKPMPSAVSDIIFAGVGDPVRGAYIDGHLSRQDTASLSQLARRLGGRYHNGNQKHIPSEWLTRLTTPDPRSEKLQFNLRVVAILVITSGAALLCLIPVLLDRFGSDWKPAQVVPAGRTAGDASGPVAGPAAGAEEEQAVKRGKRMEMTA